MRRTTSFPLFLNPFDVCFYSCFIIVLFRSGPSEPASIMVAQYPLGDERLADAKVESDMECLKSAIHAGRSLRSSYGIVPSVSFLLLVYLFFSLCVCLIISAGRFAFGGGATRTRKKSGCAPFCSEPALHPFLLKMKNGDIVFNQEWGFFVLVFLVSVRRVFVGSVFSVFDFFCLPAYYAGAMSPISDITRSHLAVLLNILH